MVARITKASNNSYEAFWRLPITDEHRNMIKGKWGADIANFGPPFGGASQAAAFLEHFVEDKRPWAHLDIAGPAVGNEMEQQGFGAKTLLYLID
mgnify:CR=1 FL=1